MSLDPKTLDLLTAKDDISEVQWIDTRTIAYLENQGRFWQYWEQTDDQEPMAKTSFLVGSTLPYAGQFVTRGLYALAADSTLKDLKHDKTFTLPGPSTDLVLDNRMNACWISFDARTDSDAIYRLKSDHAELLWSKSSFLRHLQWHPTQDACIFLEWSREELPWHDAKLLFLSFEGSETPHELALYPPGLEDQPCAEACFSPDGQSIAASFLTGDFFQLWVYKIKTRHWIQLSFEAREQSSPLRRSSRRNIAFIDDRNLVSTSSQKAFWQLETSDLYGHGKVIATALTQFQNLSAHKESGQLLTLAAGLDFPTQIVRFTRDSRNGSWQSVRSGPKQVAAMKAEPLTWATETGEKVHGLLYRDPYAKSPSPLILPIHGGPTDAVHATWPSKALAFVQQGYAVLYVNYRGSWGYGMDYHQSLKGSWGQKEISDCVSGVRSLAASGWIDPNRVGLWGGGSASFTVLWAIIRYPEIFHAAVAVFPIFDLVRHFSLCSSAEKTELLWALGGEHDLALKSPIHALDRIQRPLCLFAGGQDKLVGADQLEEAARVLKEKGLACWLTVYENEGRRWQNHATYIDYYSKVAGFFDRFLRFRGPA